VNTRNKRNNQKNNSVDKLFKKVKVFNTEEMQKRKDTAPNKSNVYQNMERYLNYLGGTKGELALVSINCSILDGLMQLAFSFPNFKSVIDFYIKQLALQLLSPNVAFSAEPVLIIGGPGIGKTAFTHALSRVIQTPCEIISLSTATSGFILAGSSPAWAEGRPGKIIEKLARNKIANPLIMLDELDKVGGDNRYDPIGSLYQLLEKETAKTFVDEGLEIATDCSHIVWMATANQEDLIPEPILSRFTVFNVRTPTKDEMKKVVNSIYNNVVKENDWGAFFDIEISPCAVDNIIDGEVTPRRIQQVIKEACAQIALEHMYINKKQLPRTRQFKLKAEHILIEKVPTKTPMGFMQP